MPLSCRGGLRVDFFRGLVRFVGLTSGLMSARGIRVEKRGQNSLRGRSENTKHFPPKDAARVAADGEPRFDPPNRYEKRAANYLAMLTIAAITFWL